MYSVHENVYDTGGLDNQLSAPNNACECTAQENAYTCTQLGKSKKQTDMSCRAHRGNGHGLATLQRGNQLSQHLRGRLRQRGPLWTPARSRSEIQAQLPLKEERQESLRRGLRNPQGQDDVHAAPLAKNPPPLPLISSPRNRMQPEKRRRGRAVAWSPTSPPRLGLDRPRRTTWC